MCCRSSVGADVTSSHKLERVANSGCAGDHEPETKRSVALTTFARSRTESLLEFESTGGDFSLSPLPHPSSHSQFAPQQHALGAVLSSTRSRLHGVGELAAHGPAKTNDIARKAVIPARRMGSAAVIQN